MIIRAILIFLACMAIGVIGVPFVIWASAGFPGEGSHGLWIPVMFGLYLGLPGGAFVGVMAALISFCFPTEKTEEDEPAPYQ